MSCFCRASGKYSEHLIFFTYFGILQPYPIMDYTFFALKILHTIPQAEMWYFIAALFANLLKIRISIRSLCLIFAWCTFGSNYSLKTFWIWSQKLGTPIFGQFCPFLFAAPIKLLQFGWEMAQPFFSLKMFNWIQVWAMAGPLKDIQSCPEARTPISGQCA